MTRALLLLFALILAVPAHAQEATPDRPNVLFLLADDLRPDWVGAFGADWVRTPNIDRLANLGFRFRQTYCMGAEQGAVCVPSRAMLLSGRYLTHAPTDLSDPHTLPEVLRDAGYATFITGKWHNGKKSVQRCFETGRAVFCGGMCDHHAVPIADLDRGKLHDQRIGDVPSSELFANAAIDFLQRRAASDDQRPFFAWIAFTAPHDPRDPPAEFRNRPDRERPPLPPNFRPQHGWNTGDDTLTIRDEQLAAWPRDPETIREQLGEYRGLVEHLDVQIGRILSALEEHGFLKNTLIVFTSDHGLALGSHGLLGKQNLYEHSMGSPLIVAGLDVPHGASDALVYLLDLYPTLCDFTGVEPPEGVDGVSLRPILTGDRVAMRDNIFTLYRRCLRAIRDDRYKLIRFTQTGKTLLYDLQEDPFELHDLAADADQAQRVDAMLAAIRAWQQRAGDELALDATEPAPLTIDLSGHQRKRSSKQPKWILDKYFGPDSR